MGGDSAEAAAAETAAVEVDGVFNHFVGGDVAFAVVARVGEVSVREVERVVDLFWGHRFVLGVEDKGLVTNTLRETVGVPTVAFGFYYFEVCGVESGV